MCSLVWLVETTRACTGTQSRRKLNTKQEIRAGEAALFATWLGGREGRRREGGREGGGAELLEETPGLAEHKVSAPPCSSVDLPWSAGRSRAGRRFGACQAHLDFD